MTDTYDNENFDENKLEWPEFSGDKEELASVLREFGYELDYSGRSGISSRNRYIVKTKDKVLNKEVLKEIDSAFEKAEKIISDRKNELVDKQFDENKYDEDGIFSCVILGGHPSNPTYYDTEKYGELSSERIAHKGSNRSYNHTYCYVLYDKEKLKNNKKKVFCFKENLEECFCEISRKYGINFKGGNKEVGFSYIVNGVKLEHSSSFDIDLENEKDVKEALERNNLSWPTIKATETQKANALASLGYDVEHVGRSGFESRNIYKIMTKDRILTQDVLQEMNKDIAKANEMVWREKNLEFDRCFDEASKDEGKCYAVLETGGSYYRERTPTSKYKEIASTRIANTKDHRRGIDHTYVTLYFDEEKLKNDKRKFIKLYVPKDMIGLVIGSRGANIKELQQKYNKKFVVEQDPIELKQEKISAIKEKFLTLLNEKGAMGVLENMDLSLENEKELQDVEKEKIKVFFKERLEIYQKNKEEENKRKRFNALIGLKNDICNSFGDEFVDMSDDEIYQRTNSYLEENADKILVMPNEEELNNMVEDMQKSSHCLKFEKDMKHKNLVDKYIEDMNVFVRQSEEKDGVEVSFEKLKEYADEKFENALANEEAYGKIVEVLSKERLDKKRCLEADKRFEDVVDDKIDEFFESGYAHPHGENYFNAVGKSRREWGYQAITENIFNQLGISDLMKEKTLYAEIYSEKFNQYKEKVVERIEQREENYYSNSLCVVEECDDEMNCPLEMPEEDKEVLKQKLKEAKKAYREKGEMKKVVGGFEALAKMIGGSEGR